MRKSLNQYRRYGAEGYAKWIAQVNNLSTIPTGTNNHSIHREAKRMLEGAFNPETEIDENPFPEDIKQYDSWSLKELKAECTNRDLSPSGTKAALAMRLKENDTPSTIGETEAPADAAADVAPEAPSEEAATIGEISNEETNGDTEQEPTIEE